VPGASAVRPTSMMAVIGGDPDEVQAAIAAAGLTAANNNGSGQVVAAGTVEQLAELQANPPAKARLIQLSVAGAFHTVHMQPAVAHLERLSRAITTHDPRTRLLSNADGQVVQSGREYLARLVKQVANPVRWDLCLATMAEIGVTGLLELPPAGTLTGIAKRNLKGIELFSLNTPDQLADAQDFIARHGDAGWANPLASTPSWRMLVSPIKGEFTKASGIETGRVVPAGTLIGTASNRRDSVEIRATHDGSVTEWLVEDGDPVAPGQPLIRLYPATEAGAQ